MNKIKKLYLIFIVLIELIIVLHIVSIIYIRVKQSSRVLGNNSENTNKYLNKLPIEVSFNSFFYNSPNASYSKSPDWLNYTANYTINSDGLNSIKNYAIEKPQNTFRILAIGDSHTYGDFVNTNESYPSQLERLFNTKYQQCIYNFDVINLGISTYDVSYATHLFDIKGKKYSPDLILWFMIYNDFYELTDVIRGYTLKCIESSDATKLPPNILASDYCWVKGQEYMKGIYNISDIFKFNSDLLSNFVQNLNTKIVIITYKDEDAKITKVIDSLKDDKKIFHYNQFNFADLDRIPDEHPSSTGYKFLANKLEEYINNNFIHCK